MGDYLGRTKDLGKKTGKGIKGFGKETFSGSILHPKNFKGLGDKTKGLGGKIKSGTGSLLNKGKGAYGKFADKFGDGSKNGIMSQSPKAGGIGKTLGKLVSKFVPGLNIGLSALNFGRRMKNGEGVGEALSNTAGDFIDPFGLGYGEKVGDMAKKAGTKEGWNLGWSNGDKDGKN